MFHFSFNSYATLLTSASCHAPHLKDLSPPSPCRKGKSKVCDEPLVSCCAMLLVSPTGTLDICCMKTSMHFWASSAGVKL